MEYFNYDYKGRVVIVLFSMSCRSANVVAICYRKDWITLSVFDCATMMIIPVHMIFIIILF